jgi:hypothetical protein
MNIKELARKPELKKITVDNPIVVEAYGEAVDFWMYDRQSVPTYLQLAQLKDDHNQLFTIIKTIIMDENGLPVLNEGEMLPIDIMIPILEAAIRELGNAHPQTSAA